MKQILILILCALMFATNLYADDKKQIQVKFKISESQYIDFYDSQIDKIEQLCTFTIADTLNQIFRFFKFQIDSCQPVLHIELADKEQKPGVQSSIKEVGFKIRIEQQGDQGVIEPVYWIFRPMERYVEELPDVSDDFIEEIIQTFNNGLQNFKEELVRNILSKVEVADEFYFIKDESMYILPLPDKENNIAKFSKFLIIASSPDEVFNSKENYDTTRVINSIKNIENAILKYNIPNNYPVGSLALERLVDGIGEIPFDNINTNDVEKRIYILKFLPIKESGLEIVPPENLSNN